MLKIQKCQFPFYFALGAVSFSNFPIFQFLQPLHRFQNVFSFSECREAEISFTGRSEARSRCSNHIRLIEQMVEKLPGGKPVFGFHPYIGCINSAEDSISPVSYTHL